MSRSQAQPTRRRRREEEERRVGQPGSTRKTRTRSDRTRVGEQELWILEPVQRRAVETLFFPFSGGTMAHQPWDLPSQTGGPSAGALRRPKMPTRGTVYLWMLDTPGLLEVLLPVNTRQRYSTRASPKNVGCDRKVGDELVLRLPREEVQKEKRKKKHSCIQKPQPLGGSAAAWRGGDSSGVR